MEDFARFMYFSGGAEQGLVEADDHIPHLSEECGDDRGELGTQCGVWEELQKRQEKEDAYPKRRDRLEHINEWEQHLAVPATFSHQRPNRKSDNER